MLGTGLGGDQHLDRLTHEGIVGVPEHLLDQLVGVHDGASGVDDHSGIRRRLQQRECRARPARQIGHQRFLPHLWFQ